MLDYPVTVCRANPFNSHCKIIKVLAIDANYFHKYMIIKKRLGALSCEVT